MPTVVQNLTFAAVSPVSLQLRGFKSTWSRTVPPIIRELNGALRSLNDAVSGAADIQSQLRPIARGDWSWFLRLVLTRPARTLLEREASSTLRLLRTASDMQGRMRTWKSLLNRSTRSINAMVLPYPVNSCPKYNNFRRSYQTVQQRLPPLIGFLDDVDVTIAGIRGRQAQLRADFDQAIILIGRALGAMELVYSNRFAIWTAGLALGITAWGWRLTNMSESRWDSKSYAQKRDSFYRFFLNKRNEMRSTRAGMTSAKQEIVSFFSELSSIQTTVQTQKTLATNVNSQISTVSAPDVCPASYSGLVQTTAESIKSSPLPWVLGAGALALVVMGGKSR